MEPDRNLILLYEDIDSLMEIYGEKNLLSMMDGQFQFENILHIATTNYIDSIPDRIKNRPSRFDEIVEIQNPTTEERKIFIQHLLQSYGDKYDLLTMVKDTEGFSMAHIKELIICVYMLDKDYSEAVDRLKNMSGKNHHDDKEECQNDD